MKPIVTLALACVLLTGCAQPEPVTSPAPAPGLGAAPVISDAEPTGPAAPAGDGVEPAPERPETEADTPSAIAPEVPGEQPPVPAPTGDAGSEDEDVPGAVTSAPSGTLRLLDVDDDHGDHGPQGPAWVDLVAFEALEIGNDLRVTLRFADDLPPAPAKGEVPLISVDVGDGQDAYQLFVEGGGQSWQAYLQTPEGFVVYPGTFEIGGAALVLQVPFNSVGSPTRAAVRVLVEWSRDSGLVGVLNPTSEDRLDGEPHRFDRAP